MSQGTNGPLPGSGKADARPRGTSTRGARSVFLSIILVLVVLAIGSLVALRLSLPEINRFRPEVEWWISEATGQNLSIGALDAIWRGWTPELIIRGIRLSNTATDASILQSLRIRLGVNPLSVFGQNGFRMERISLSDVSLTIIRSRNGTLRLAGTRAPSSPPSEKLGIESLLPWLLRQPHVDVMSANIRWHDEENENASFSMPNTHLGIRRTGPRHQIRITLHSPDDVKHSEGASSLETTSGVLSGIADISVQPTTLSWSGRIFLRMDGFDLNRFPLLQRTLAPLAISGTASSELWTSWNRGRLEYVEGDFAFRDLVLGGMNADTTMQSKEKDGLSEKRDCTPLCAIVDKTMADQKVSIERMNGRLKLSRSGIDDWRLQLRQFTFAASGKEWPSTQARVELAQSRNQHGWLVKIRDAELQNEDITARLVGAGQWFEDQSSPDVRLVMDLEHRRLDTLERYLPMDAMSKILADWLRHAFPKGEITEGRVLFHGRIADFPFDNGEGVFEVRVKTSEETTFRYAESWPPIEQAKADIDVYGRSLTITLNSGIIQGARIGKGRAEIHDIMAETPILTVHSHAEGDVREGLAFLREGPLAAEYGSRIAGLHGTGKHRLDLDLRMPLPPDTQVRTRGSITFLNDILDIKIPWTASDKTHLILHRVNGVLAFDEQGIVGKLMARYLGRPITLEIAKAPKPENSTRFTIDGLDTDTLLAYPTLKSALQEIPPSSLSVIRRITDKATWQITLDLPDDWGPNNRTGRLKVVSDLRGATASLPPPLSGRPFQLEMSLGKEKEAEAKEQHVRFRFGSQVRGIFSPGKPGNQGKWRSAIRIGAGRIILPEAGLRIDGNAAYFSLDQWRPLWTSLMGSKSVSGTQRKPVMKTPPFGKAPNLQARLSFDKFIAFGRTLDDTDLRVDGGSNNAWHIQILSDQLRGHIRIPPQGDDDTTIAVALTELRLPLSDDGADFAPENIPPLRLVCDNLHYDNRRWGKIELLELSPDSQGLRIERIRLKSENARIQGKGLWEQHTTTSSRSRFQIEVDGPDLGKLLSSFGYEGDVAKRGNTHLALDIGWPGPPTKFQLERMEGTLDVEITDGRLLAIEPGATGRVFGLLSITLLPRRLLLDFRDIFQEGLVYDRMKGKFKIHDGKAKTDPVFSVEGPTSRIEITGATGLVTEEYNQIARVTPKISSSLPLAAIGIVQKLVDSPFFDEVFIYRYAIKGTWDAPEIERVENP